MFGVDPDYFWVPLCTGSLFIILVTFCLHGHASLLLRPFCAGKGGRLFFLFRLSLNIASIFVYLHTHYFIYGKVFVYLSEAVMRDCLKTAWYVFLFFYYLDI